MTPSSKSEDKVAPQIESPAPTGEGSQPSSPPADGSRPAQTPQLQIDDSKALAAYANFCRVTGTPEEMIIDFGLSEQPFGPAVKPIPITHRIITNYYTAKRLLQVLHVSLQRHEAAFGVLETDIGKRARPGMAARPQAPNG